MITISNLYLKFIREYYALYDINMEIKAGEKVSFVGAEDSGKTTLLRVIAKLEKITSGSVFIKNIPLKKISFKSDISVGYLPVKPIYLKKKSVYENYVYLLRERNLSVLEIEERINKVLIDFNLEKYRDDQFESLTLFEQYLVSLGRLALRDLDLILVDNIFEKLNKKQTNEIVTILNEHFLNNKKLTSIIATSVEELADKLLTTKYFFKYGSRVDSLDEEIEEWNKNLVLKQDFFCINLQSNLHFLCNNL